MLYSANGSPLGAVDGERPDEESPVVGAAPPPSAVKKITMSVRKRARGRRTRREETEEREEWEEEARASAAGRISPAW